MNPLFEKGRRIGFEEGYKKGYAEGMNGKDAVLNNDILAIYGMMCICLHEDCGWDSEKIESLCRDIQYQWNNYADWSYEERKNGRSVDKIEDMVKGITGVDFVQILGVEDGV